VPVYTSILKMFPWTNYGKWMMYLYSFFTTLSSTYISLSVYHLQDCLGYCEEFKKWRRHSYQMTYYLRGEISSLLIMTQGGGFEVS
jgi:hypothetical protein